MPIMRCVAHPKIGEREVVAALLAHHLIRSEQILLAGRGSAGKGFATTTTTAMGLRLLRPDRKDETHTHGNLAGSVNRSSRSTTPSRASSGWRSTVAAPLMRCLPASPNDYWPWPPDLAQLDHRSHRKRSLTVYDH